jgi:hypothetical protein
MDFKKMKLFQKAAIMTLFLFFGMMGFVIVAAYSRQSGSTGLDMAKVQKMRYEARHPDIANSP